MSKGATFASTTSSSARGTICMMVITHGVHSQLVDGARLRRAQVDALELVLGRRDPSFTIKWQNEPKFNFKQSHICFSRKPCRFRDPVALAFVWRMPDARSVRASATWGGRESAQCLVPVHHSTRQSSLRA